MIKRFLALTVFIVLLSASASSAYGGVFAYNPVMATFEGVETTYHDEVLLVPFRDVCENLGAFVVWVPQSNSVYARRGKLDIKVTLDSTSALVNGKKTEMAAPCQNIDGVTYVPLDFIIANLKPVTSGNFEAGLNLWNITPFSKTHGWTQLSDGYIAHGGGGIANIPCTNSKESLVRSYWLGHKVYEFDLNTTTDGKLAVVHDWHGYGGIQSSEEWKKVKIADIFEAMLWEDLLDLMIQYKDIFVITDTKSFEYDEKGIKEQFKILADTVMAKDPSLFKRIIPQIYDQKCYKLLMEAYPFNSVIYTLYASPDSDKEVAKFVSEHSNIKVVTMAPVRYSDSFAKSLYDKAKYIYFFTINSLNDIAGYRKNGVRGFYTDFIFPYELNKQ